MTTDRLFVGTLAAMLLAASPVVADEARVTFLHFNDVYEFVPDDDTGGLAGVKTVVERERAAHPNAVLTFGGDLLSPSVASSLTHGAHMIDMMNRLAPTVAVLGNHEFDFGADELRTRMTESRFPWLVTNVSEADGRPFAGAARAEIVERNGIRIGLLGVTTVETATLSAGGRDAVFGPEVETALATVRALRDQGAELVVALTHLELAQDMVLARAVRGIDLILGGHDHHAVTLQEGDTLIVKAGHDGIYLAAVDMTIERNSGNPRVRAAAWRLESTRGVPGETEMAELANRHLSQLDAAMDAPLATLAADLDTRQHVVRGSESSFGDFVADALRKALGADAALVNGGGLRGNRLYAAGTTLTRADILREMPFGNTAMLLELSGADVVAALEHGVAKAPALSGAFPQVSGLSFAFDPNAAPGHRVRDARINGMPVEPGSRYRIATSDYLADGGDAYTMLRNGRVLVDRSAASLLSTVVMDHARSMGVIAAPAGGRVR